MKAGMKIRYRLKQRDDGIYNTDITLRIANDEASATEFVGSMLVPLLQTIGYDPTQVILALSDHYEEMFRAYRLTERRIDNE